MTNGLTIQHVQKYQPWTVLVVLIASISILVFGGPKAEGQPTPARVHHWTIQQRAECFDGSREVVGDRVHWCDGRQEYWGLPPTADEACYEVKYEEGYACHPADAVALLSRQKVSALTPHAVTFDDAATVPLYNLGRRRAVSDPPTDFELSQCKYYSQFSNHGYGYLATDCRAYMNYVRIKDPTLSSDLVVNICQQIDSNGHPLYDSPGADWPRRVPIVDSEGRSLVEDGPAVPCPAAHMSVCEEGDNRPVCAFRVLPWQKTYAVYEQRSPDYPMMATAGPGEKTIRIMTPCWKGCPQLVIRPCVAGGN